MTTTPGPMTLADADEIMYRVLTAMVAELDEAGVELTDHEIQIVKVAIMQAAAATIDLCQERGVAAGMNGAPDA